MRYTPFGKYEPQIREFYFTSTHKEAYDSTGHHIEHAMRVMARDSQLLAVHNDELEKVYLDEETLESVTLEAKWRFKFAMEWIKEVDDDTTSET